MVGFVRVVRILLDTKDIKVRFYLFFTIFFLIAMKSQAGVLHDAIESGNLGQLRGVVQKNVQAIDQQDGQGNTALMLAAQRGKADVAALLIENKAQLNLRNKKGQTALILAIEHQHQSFAEKLIEAGANVSIADENQLSPLQLAVAINSPALIQSLGKKGAARGLTAEQQFDLLAVCISLAQADTLNALFKIKLNPKVINAEKMTLLMLVPMAYMSEKRKLLQQKKNSDDLIKRFTPIVDSLLSAGTDPSAKDQAGLTALDYVMGVSAQSKQENPAYTMNELFNLMQKKGVQ